MRRGFAFRYSDKEAGICVNNDRACEIAYQYTYWLIDPAITVIDAACDKHKDIDMRRLKRISYHGDEIAATQMHVALFDNVRN